MFNKVSFGTCKIIKKEKNVKENCFLILVSLWEIYKKI